MMAIIVKDMLINIALTLLAIFAISLLMTVGLTMYLRHPDIYEDNCLKGGPDHLPPLSRCRRRHPRRHCRSRLLLGALH